LYPPHTKGGFKSEEDTFRLQEFQRYTTRSIKKALILNVFLLVFVIFLEFRLKKELQQTFIWSFLEGATPGTTALHPTYIFFFSRSYLRRVFQDEHNSVRNQHYDKAGCLSLNDPNKEIIATEALAKRENKGKKLQYLKKYIY
jgi:hypothetical protein